MSEDDMIVCKVTDCEVCGREMLGLFGSESPAICQDCAALPNA